MPAWKFSQESTSGQDVSTEYVDLQSRLRNLEATSDRIKGFLDQAETVEEADEIEAVLMQSGSTDKELITRMVRVARDVRDAIHNERLFGSFSTRRLIDWARMSTQFDVRESARYTVLSKLTRYDAEVVEDIIDLYF